MILCFASLVKVLVYCAKQGITQKVMCGRILSTINFKYGNDLEGDDSTVSALLACKHGLSPDEIVNVISTVDFEDVKRSISINVIPLLDSNTLPCGILALKHIIQNDKHFDSTSAIEKLTIKEIEQLVNIDVADFITNLLYYTVSGINNSEGKPTIKSVTKEFVTGFKDKAPTISLIHENNDPPTELSKTLVDSDFNDVFTKVKSKAALELCNRSGIEMYYLDVADCGFDYSELTEYLLSSVGRYVYSRIDIQKLIDKNKKETIGLKAVRLMRQNGSADEADTGNELGDMLIYSFLEEVLNAPKILSKVEIRGKQSKSDGIHLLKYTDGKQIKHQLVFGTSSIHDSIYSAIDEVFEVLVQIKKGSANERSIVDSTLGNNTFDSGTIDLLKTILIPQKGKPKIPMAFGVFIGYSVGVINNNYDEYFSEVIDKIKKDIEDVIPYIMKKANEMDLEGHSFYFYFLPMNHAETDKKEIMEELIG